METVIWESQGGNPMQRKLYLQFTMLDTTAKFAIPRDIGGDLSSTVDKTSKLQEAIHIIFSDFMKGKVCNV